MEVKVFVNGDTVPVSSSKSVGSEKYEVSFVPLSDVDHKIEIEFNKDRVSGSPFVAKVVHGKYISFYFL